MANEMWVERLYGTSGMHLEMKGVSFNHLEGPQFTENLLHIWDQLQVEGAPKPPSGFIIH